MLTYNLLPPLAFFFDIHSLSKVLLTYNPVAAACFLLLDIHSLSKLLLTYNPVATACFLL
jgi:hypothetical protein